MIQSACIKSPEVSKKLKERKGEKLKGLKGIPAEDSDGSVLCKKINWNEAQFVFSFVLFQVGNRCFEDKNQRNLIL